MPLTDNFSIPAYITLELLTNYLAYQCTKEEVALIDEWYSSYDRKPEDLDEAVAKYTALQQKKFMEIMAIIRKKEK